MKKRILLLILVGLILFGCTDPEANGEEEPLPRIDPDLVPECTTNEDCISGCCQEEECQLVDGECGYQEGCSWINYECCSDEGCNYDEACANNECSAIECDSCSYIENHECKEYECCSNEDCSSSHTCIDNSCVLKSGCTYDNPPCEWNEDCIDTECIPKEGCAYGNPFCDAGYYCANNVCVMSYGCQYNNPPCQQNETCFENECVLNTGCEYDDLTCSENEDCINNVCVPKQGCLYNNPNCSENEDCIDNECIPRTGTGCQYSNPSCTEGHICLENVCLPKYYCLNDECEDESIDFVIITRPLFLEALYEFTNWKVENDFSVGILTVDYIHSVKGESNPSKSMKSMIRDFVLEGDTNYFLLVGDTTAAQSGIEIQEWAVGGGRTTEGVDILHMYDLSLSWNVPSGHACDNESRCFYEHQATDLYFADLDDEIWQENDDGYIISPHRTYNSGESDLGDPVLDFETIVARIPIREPSEFEPIFNKFKSYERSDTLDALLDSDTFDLPISETSSCSSPFFESEEQAALSREGCRENIWIIKNLLEEEGYEFNAYTFDPHDETESQNAQDLLFHETNNVFEIFHGSYRTFSIVHSDDVSEASTIFPLLVPKSCYTGAFANPYYNETVIEKLFKQENGPVLVTDPPNLYLFLKNSLEGKTVGEAFYNINGTRGVMVVVASNVLFGDPSLRVFSNGG